MLNNFMCGIKYNFECYTFKTQQKFERSDQYWKRRRVYSNFRCVYNLQEGIRITVICYGIRAKSYTKIIVIIYPPKQNICVKSHHLVLKKGSIQLEVNILIKSFPLKYNSVYQREVQLKMHGEECKPSCCKDYTENPSIKKTTLLNSSYYQICDKVNLIINNWSCSMLVKKLHIWMDAKTTEPIKIKFCPNIVNVSNSNIYTRHVNIKHL